MFLNVRPMLPLAMKVLFYPSQEIYIWWTSPCLFFFLIFLCVIVGVRAGVRWLVLCGHGSQCGSLPGAPGQISLTGTPPPGCHGMTQPLQSTGRQLATWPVTSSSAGTSRRYVGGFSIIQTGREEAAWRGWRGHSCAIYPLLSGRFSEHLGLWAKERKKKFLNFSSTNNSEGRGVVLTSQTLV